MSIIHPGRGDVHVDRPLTQISEAFVQDRGLFVADRVFPILPVDKRSDLFFKFDRGDFFRDELKRRAPATKAATVGYNLSTDSYSCDVWALAHDISDQIRSNADEPLQLERAATEMLTHKGMIRKDRAWAASYFVASQWTTDLAGVDSASPGAGQFGRWDRADSTPIEDIREAGDIVQGLTGLRPNKMVLQRQAYSALLDHPDIVGRLDRGQTQGPAVVMRQNLAALFELDEVLVLDGSYNAANEGAADDIQFIGGKHALLVHAARRPGLMTASAGYTFSWAGLLGAGNSGQRIKRYRIEERAADRIEIEMAFDHKLVAPDLGVFFENAVS